MDSVPRIPSFSRRQFLARNAGLIGLALAACASPQAAQQPAAPAAGAAPTTPPAAPAAAPTTVAAATAPAAAAAKPATGVFNVWFNANWNTVTDEAVGNTFVEWGAKNGVKVEWQSIPAAPATLAKQSAAVAAGQPPEVSNQNLIYWYTQSEFPNLKELLSKF